MLTKEQNQRLTQVGPGTPGGNLLRYYWYPVATVPELDRDRVMAVRLLDEDLALFKNDAGQLGLVAQRCAHRSASLAYGIPEDGGIRCPYHGWKFSPEGQCIEQPAEPDDSAFKDKVQIAAYPVQELGGLIFAYLGPQPAPLLPRYDLFVRDDIVREIGISRLPCNWVQIMENSMDPHHLEWLHMVYTNWVLKKQGKAPAMKPRHHKYIAFDVFEYGIMKRRLWEGETEESDEWQVGHPILFPNYLEVMGTPGNPQYQIRVPVDDSHTLHFWYYTRPRGADEPVQRPGDIPVWDNPHQHEDGRLVVETVNGQDMMVWVVQGPVADRSIERLGTSDEGVILFRKVLDEQIARVERGEEPTMSIVRDESKNYPWIHIPREAKVGYSLQGVMNTGKELAEAAKR